MMAHPLILAVVVLDVVSLLFLCHAAAGAVRIEANWDPGSSSRRQIRLETSYETGAISGKTVLALLAASTTILVFGVTNVFPGIIPGAMCGTGVLQATHGQGGRAFLFRFLGLALLYLWSVLEGLNRDRPDFPMARLNARILLAASPLAILAFLDTFDAFRSLNIYRPVDCCTVVYDRLAGNGPTPGAAQLDGPFLVIPFAALTFLLLLSGVAGLAAGPARFGRLSAATAVVAVVWAPVAAAALVRVFAAYYYEVLHHHCPWCLFLPEHGFAGFPLFLLLGGAFIEAPVAYALYRASKGCPGLGAAGVQKARRATLWMVILAVLFTVMAVWPALSWRLRFGVWMG